jgi:hypothetical protein
LATTGLIIQPRSCAPVDFYDFRVSLAIWCVRQVNVRVAALQQGTVFLAVEAERPMGPNLAWFVQEALRLASSEH